jgi:cytochrome c
MDSFEFNKIAMAVLGTVFLVMGLNFAADGIFHMENPEQKGYAIELAEADTSAEPEEDAGPAFEPVEPLLASADSADGANVFKKCAACHNVNAGGANKVGPALYGIVNRDIASVDGFSYSGALKEYGDGKQWTYEELNGFLWKPKTYVKGTSMGFGGLKKVEDRANLIAYLREQADTPAELPAQ